MSRQGRGSTGLGRPAVLPAGGYEPPASVEGSPDGSLVVTFHGDDDRRGVFDVSMLPLPDWHAALAAAFAERTGAGGGLRTRASAVAAWGSVVRLVRFLGSLPDGPTTPDQLTPAQLDAFYDHRVRRAPTTAVQDLGEARLLFMRPALRSLLSEEVFDHVHQRRRAPSLAVKASSAPAAQERTPTSGFSDGELARLLAALRTDAARIRDRIRAGEDLLRRYQDAPQALGDTERQLGELLADMAATGKVPSPPGVAFSSRAELAGQLFLTRKDLPPLMMLAAALTERNGETIKELPAAHRVLEERAVEVAIVKRRRGPQRWFQTVTWEIGVPGRELRSPGGFYLLLRELTARSRALCGSELLWCVWRNGYGARVGSGGEHWAPFEKSLTGTSILPSVWVANRPRPLQADPPAASTGAGAAASPDPCDTAGPLRVSFNRIKTSMEVRRTKRMGGHLPSTAKSNSMPVLFRHYLSGDPVITAWAEEVLGEALVDAEQCAIGAHQRAMHAAGGGPRVLSGPVDPDALHEQAGLKRDTARQVADGELDTGWAACIDPDHHPVTDAACRISFLDCFHCGNCLITRDHVPRLLGVLDALAGRRRELSEDDWWARYGPAWAAIRHDILPKFTPAELQQSQKLKPADALLDLIENPWEQP